MKKIKYCTSCMYPETKPDLWFNEEGKCSACINFENRTEIDWVERKQEFLQITERYKSIDGSNYDCIIPVSGGKDSTYQVIKVLQAGLNPLCVTAETDSLSELGRRNLENLKRLGVDHVNVTPNPKVRRKLSRLALREVGDIQWAEHVTIFTIPIQVAVEKNIPLIVWGENSQHEYGGPAAAAENNVLDRRWLEEFGGCLVCVYQTLLVKMALPEKI
ncbi:N-acetyl sugar amidotransferase [Vibrio vulnificus]|uniref:N-acetyl sugar amidotransferase n=1 Tax=Vibrio vulnificus TaxID=672 RepID=UPI0022B27C09|nr:N-acetyl sugar amidotransferase [Vibrio vulnificus]